MIDPAASIVLPVLRQEDAWLEPTAVEACLGRAADIVSTWKRSYAADGVTGFPRLRRQLEWARCDALPTLEAKATYLTHFLLFGRALLLRVGGVDEALGDLAGVDDYDLIWVLRARARWFGGPTHVVGAEGHGGGTG